MLYVWPDYFEKFKCVADRCEATCCAGWQIVIDEESLERYENEASDYGAVLCERIDWEEGAFKQDGRKRCAFLKEDNLCEMYQKLGEESLCFTCANYPRHIEEFEDVREITLAISCPEVARIILEQKEPVGFVEEEIEEDEEEIEDFDPFFFSYLEDARKIVIAILQNRNLPVALRTGLVQKMAEEMQEIIEERDLFELADVFEKYGEEENLTQAVLEMEQELRSFCDDTKEYVRYSKRVFDHLYELEHLSDDWEGYLEQCRKTLYGGGPEGYLALQEQFRKWYLEGAGMERDMENILEQLLVYFVFTYFCGAVYDDNVIGEIRMSVDSVHIIYQMCTAKWAEQNGTLSEKDIQQIVYRYSRELEHSDVNLEIMEG